jgi:fatty acid desaturase
MHRKKSRWDRIRDPLDRMYWFMYVALVSFGVKVTTKYNNTKEYFKGTPKKEIFTDFLAFLLVTFLFAFGPAMLMIAVVFWPISY